MLKVIFLSFIPKLVLNCYSPSFCQVSLLVCHLSRYAIPISHPSRSGAGVGDDSSSASSEGMGRDEEKGRRGRQETPRYAYSSISSLLS